MGKNAKPIFDYQIYDDGSAIFFAKGEYSEGEFCNAAQNAYGGTEVDPRDVHHGYARWCGMFEDGRYIGRYLDYPVKPKRGAFMITYATRFHCPDLAASYV